MRWKDLEAESKATHTNNPQNLNEAVFFDGETATYVHKYIVYNKIDIQILSVDDSLNRTARMNHRQIKELWIKTV